MAGSPDVCCLVDSMLAATCNQVVKPALFRALLGFVALVSVCGCVNPEAYYRKIMDPEVGVLNRRGLMDKYGPPTRIDRLDGSEYRT